ncbi:hypothetical protein LOTGIDRAFT_155079 [Lottia gigantea]|uniref:OTU domain-containing protein n=1 Tax=Lottia gigantea TaxID=225164 RepID=V3ZSN8_LOTGI|nr:hypothetical protein LOTGIDRAFT_155079 [Lottia gigantea]ESO85590.1 hypothetical protein LOTGIDRAFT_155079 [Lottia gigantea]
MERYFKCSQEPPQNSVVEGLIANSSPRKRQALHNIKGTHSNFESSLKSAIGKLKTTPDGKKAVKLLSSAMLQTPMKEKHLKKLGVSKKRLSHPFIRKQRNDSIPTSVKNEVYRFFLLPEISRALPHKRYVTKYGSGYLLLTSLAAAYKLFKKQEPDIKLGFRKFVELKPKQVRLLKKSYWDACVCPYCINISYKLNVLNRYVGEEKQLKNEHDLFDMLLCSYTNRFADAQCVNGTCNKCSDYESTLTEYYNVDFSQNVTWTHWEKVHSNGKTKRDLVIIEGNLQNLFDEFVQDIIQPLQGESFICHLFTANWQFAQFKRLKQNLPQNCLLMIMDFTQNYAVILQDAIKLQAFTHKQITIHPIVVFYKNKDLVLETDINQLRPESEQLRPLPGTRKIHEVRSTSTPYQVCVRKLSCFCGKTCYCNGTDCVNKDYTGEFIRHALVTFKTSDGNFEDILKDLASTNDQVKYVQKCLVYSNKIPPIEDILCPSVLQIKGVMDKVALDLLPELCLHEKLFPVRVIGDGNCLPRSLSVVVYGDEKHAAEMRVRIAVELSLHKAKYLDNQHLSLGLPVEESSTKFVNIFTMFSPFYIPPTKLTKDVIEKVFIEEAMETAVNGSYMVIWHLFASSSIIGYPIYSVYPERGNPNIRHDLHRIIHPIIPKREEKIIYIMWSTCRTDMTMEHWIPNHFVPLLPLEIKLPQGLIEDVCMVNACNIELNSHDEVPMKIEQHLNELFTDLASDDTGEYMFDMTTSPIIEMEPYGVDNKVCKSRLKTGMFVLIALPYVSRKRDKEKLFVAEILDVKEENLWLRYMVKQDNRKYVWPAKEDCSLEPIDRVKKVLSSPLPTVVMLHRTIFMPVENVTFHPYFENVTLCPSTITLSIFCYKLLYF